MWVIRPNGGHYTITNYHGDSHRIYKNKDGRFGYYSGYVYNDNLWDIEEYGSAYRFKSVSSGQYLYANKNRQEINAYTGNPAYTD